MTLARDGEGFMPEEDKVHDPRGSRRATEHVFHAVRAGILHGDYRPNERLIEVNIAEQLGTSRTPVREALQRLAVEGLIVGGRQGWSVREFTPVEIREIFEVRGALEAFAAELAAERAAEEEIAVIEEIHARERALTVKSGSRREQVELNDEFHAAVFRAAGNRRLLDASDRNLSYYFNLPVARTLSDPEAAETISEHSRVVEAIRAHDREAAGRAARAHVARSLALILENLGLQR